MNPYSLRKDELIERIKFRCEHGHHGLSHPKCYDKLRKRPEHIGYLDIETNGLFPSFHIILSYAILDNDKVYGRIITTEEIKSKDIDKKILSECIEDMKKFDTVVTYNGARFDIPFLRTRALKWGLKDFPVYGTVKHRDAYYIAKHTLRLPRKSMDSVSRALGIPGKNHVDGDLWLRASLQGDKKALGYIFDHNVRDVEVLKKVYRKLRPFTREVRRSI